MRNYVYGTFEPFEGGNLVRDQLRLAHAYQCALVAIERERRNTVDRLYRARCPVEWSTYERAQSTAEEAARAVHLARSTGGDMLAPDEEMKAERNAALEAAKTVLKAARVAEKEARDAWYAAKKAATPGLRKRLRMCDAGAQSRNKRAYNLAGTVGLAWGTRLKIGESCERAAQASMKEGTLPRFPRFDGGGLLAVQLQGESGVPGHRFGLSVDNALAGKDTRFRLEVVDRATWQMLRGKNAFTSTKKDGRVVELPQPKPDSQRSARKREQGYEHGLAIARLRVGSDGRAPIFAAFSVVVHRPLPKISAIKWAQVHARRVGARTEWQLILSVDDDEPALREVRQTLAVNLGWRQLEDGGLRVGYAVGSDGREEEVRVPAAYAPGIAHVDSLRSIRDRLFEDAKKTLSAWLEEAAAPAWLIEETTHISLWRGQKRLARLMFDWRNRRFEKDGDIWALLTAWQKKDRHLWFWEADEREKLLRMRRDIYRQVAARWAREYDQILVTDMDLRDFAEEVAPEEGNRQKGGVQRRMRFFAAPSELRQAIANACSTRGAAFIERDGKWKTQTCNACGIVFAFAAKQDLVHTCECGARWDQDANHCRNLLASNDQRKTPEQTPKKTRWQKKREKKTASGSVASETRTLLAATGKE